MSLFKCVFLFAVLALSLVAVRAEGEAAPAPTPEQIEAHNAEAKKQFQQAVQDTVKWFTANGGFVKSLGVKHFDEMGNGLAAMEDIPAGELLIKVPRALQVSAKNILETDEKFKALVEKNPTWSGLLVVSLYLLTQLHNPESFYRPMFKLIPATYDTPLFFTIDQLNAFKGSQIYDVALARVDQVSKQYKELFPVLEKDAPELFPEGVNTMNHFAWALSTVLSRSFTNARYGDRDKPVVPFVDLINFQASGNVEVSYDEEDNCIVKSVKDIKKGDKISTDFPKVSNHLMLMDHGVMLPDNPHNMVTFTVGIPQDDPLKDQRIALLNAAEITSFQHKVFGNGIPLHLLATARVLFLTAEEMQGLTKEKLLGGNPVSIRNEFRVFRSLIAGVQAMRKQLGSTLEDDIALIRAGNFPDTYSQIAANLRASDHIVLSKFEASIGGLWERLITDQDIAADTL
eukprot:GFYU01002697.1.p1 GENE.GFYU01002697.1~~GFYU01002697.1.p1  ORF type:complete len:457 (-),score=197.33 GFYU01002697.1:189-1559(-)